MRAEKNHPYFNFLEFEGIKNESGSNSYYLSVKKWVSPEFKLYIIKNYQRLKEDENSKLSLEWNVNRVLSKLNYKIHTDAIKENLVSNDLIIKEISITYANEADVLNVALFGKTAKEWRNENQDLKGNIRVYATIEQLIAMVNLQNMNANFIEKGLEQKQRLIELNKIAREKG